MKKLGIFTALFVFANLAQASYFEDACSTADGRISNITGHTFDTTLRFQNWQEGREIIEKPGLSQLTEIEELAVIEESQADNCGGFGSYDKTYVIKAVLKLGEDASKAAREFVGEQPRIFLCKHHSNWMSPPCEGN